MTERQQKILKAVIEEFMREASPVGSVNIVNRYKLGISSATVRNEMVDLAEQGYLSKSHVSSGRVPTDLGIRFFVQELMDEISLSTSDAVRVRMEIFRNRFEEELLIRNVMQFLSDETGYASLCLLGDTMRYSGLSSLTDYDELRDVEVIDAVLYLLENSGRIRKIFERSATDDVCIIIGSECEVTNMENCAVVFSGLRYVGDKSGYIGVLGPRRMRYSRVIPVVRYVRRMIQDSVKGW